MTGKSPVFGTRPSDPEAWVRRKENTPPPGEAFTARLTIDVTPEMRGRIRMAAFRKGVTMSDMLRALLEREYPADAGGAP
jgi:hypothetical protein